MARRRVFTYKKCGTATILDERTVEFKRKKGSLYTIRKGDVWAPKAHHENKQASSEVVIRDIILMRKTELEKELDTTETQIPYVIAESPLPGGKKRKIAFISLVTGYDRDEDKTASICFCDACGKSSWDKPGGCPHCKTPDGSSGVEEVEHDPDEPKPVRSALVKLESRKDVLGRALDLAEQIATFLANVAGPKMRRLQDDSEEMVRLMLSAWSREENAQERVVAFLRANPEVPTKDIAKLAGVPVGTVNAWKAHLTMGTYDKSEAAE